MAVVSFTTPNSPLLDPRTGSLTREWIKWFQNVAETVNTGFDPNGNYQGPIGANATIVGRHTLATIVHHLSDLGVIQPGGIDFSVTSPDFAQITGTAAPAQIPTATSAAQGAVKLPVGAPGSTLGSAAFNSTGDFDVAGAAAAAQANAETFAANANNLTSGTVNAGRIPSGIPFVSYGVGAPAAAGTQDNIYFDTTGTPYHGYVYNLGAWVQFS